MHIQDFHLPRYHEIPDVGLYLDQTVKYINRFLTPLHCPEITASMVSNYVKKDYIRNPEKKQYSAEQVAYLLFISIAKLALPMEHIARLFAMQRSTYSSQVAYDYFCMEFENVLQYVFHLKGQMDTVGETTSQTKTMLRSAIIAIANILYLRREFESQAPQQVPPPERK
ncbi:MAG: DUF1836 domain-containing protein [Clostridiales bacterium]|nr:DUF1836 domain-containing protein [Clostridiales bacterium]